MKDEQDGIEVYESGAEPGSPLVLVPIIRGGNTNDTLKLATKIAKSEDAELLIAKTVVYPEQTPLEPPPPSIEEHHETLKKVMGTKVDENIGASGVVCTGRKITNILLHLIETYSVETTVVEPFEESGSVLEKFRTQPIYRLMKNANYQVIMPRLEAFPSYISSVLLPVAGGPHSSSATEVVRMISSKDTSIKVIHVVDEKDEKRMSEAGDYIETAREKLKGFAVSTEVLEGGVTDTIVEESEKYDITVIGAPTRNRLKRLVFGSKSEEIRENTENTITVSSG